MKANQPYRVPVPRLLLLGLLAVLACQQPPAPAEVAGEPGIGASADSPAMADLMVMLGVAEEKIGSLAAAMPEDSWGWRPMEGVRSVGEVYLHVAADNYFIPVLMGVEAPAATGITQDYATVQAYEGAALAKADALAELEASFRHLEMAFEATEGNLDRELDLGGENPLSVRSLWVQAITHLHEHLGQGIAYARSNNVAPPWSM